MSSHACESVHNVQGRLQRLPPHPFERSFLFSVSSRPAGVGILIMQLELQWCVMGRDWLLLFWMVISRPRCSIGAYNRLADEDCSTQTSEIIISPLSHRLLSWGAETDGWAQIIPIPPLSDIWKAIQKSLYLLLFEICSKDIIEYQRNYQIWTISTLFRTLKK